jgi:hypothetical protein
METPVLQPSVLFKPAAMVISSNNRFPLFRNNLSETILPEKYRSGSPSLLISPIPTPAPLYIY